MKKIFIIAVIGFLAACSQPAGNQALDDLHSRRDSLQSLKFEIEKKLNTIDARIAVLDSSVNPQDKKIIKKIAQQKNRIVAIDAKIRKMENQMTARDEKTLVPVTVKEIQPETFNHYIITYGEVKAKNYAMISPEMNGRIEKIHVLEGQQVDEGQLLVSLNTESIEKQMEGVRSSLELAVKTFRKLDTLWKQNIGSEMEYLSAKNRKESLESQLESLLAQQRMAQIRAPFNGIVNKIYPKKGELAMPSVPVVEFVNLDRLTITADVSETYMGKIKKGQPVELTFSALPDLRITTPVTRLSRVIHSASRTFEIEMEIDNPGQRIKPNVVSTIRVNDFSSDSAFVVPSLAVRKDISGEYVYTVVPEDQKNRVVKKYVTTGLSYEEKTMIPRGLQKGDLVVVEGYHLVSSGVEVNLVESKEKKKQ
ncbi:MAG: efflux RND transporter periplasmic adaptor subunit [Bacteroidales bacterium]|jgi:RND family efflux transporter MFP subunit|nr:efflux RND transporter periplasmic adaptor subunit [Bacteroidales bacterium]